MLTKLTIRNFKNLADVEIELAQQVVFVGPNNSGKTSALQALTLWDIGAKRWLEKKGNWQKSRKQPKKRPGITINRRDLVFLPVPATKLLWHGLRVSGNNIEMEVEGTENDKVWSCGLEFYYANSESFYCRPLKDSNGNFREVPREAGAIKVTYLPPMSGLSSNEPLLQSGTINTLLGQGQTAEVLRNLCYSVYQNENDKWNQLVELMQKLFGIRLSPPNYLPGSGEITIEYEDNDGTKLDISSSGRGQQQTMLLLAHMMANPGCILLLDEPDAHLEILRQKGIYDLIRDIASDTNCQVVVASHSELILNEATAKDTLIAFVGKPHRIDDRGSQVLKSLKEFGFEHYLNAETTGWVLYVEGSTDLSILRQLATKLGHPAAESLMKPFSYEVGNHPLDAKNHFYALKEAKQDLVGIAIFDSDAKNYESEDDLVFLKWRQREIENYLCNRKILLNFAKQIGLELTWGVTEKGDTLPVGSTWVDTMSESIDELEQALRVTGEEPWSNDIKASDQFLKPLFENFFKKLELPNTMLKTNFHRIAECMEPDDIDAEIIEKLDAIAKIAEQAAPRTS